MSFRFQVSATLIKHTQVHMVFGRMFFCFFANRIYGCQIRCPDPDIKAGYPVHTVNLSNALPQS